jgi:REP element-mobilizing transposase RayT
MFETGQDLRYFASLLAQEVRRGLIEIDAQVGLSTHFHMLVESRLGRLWEAMRNILNAYVRWFNRGRKRDGPLMRGRFESRPVDSIAYRMQLVRYIDFNPVEARLVEEPWQYPYGSARFHISERGPRWLRREWIDDVLRTSPQRNEDRTKAYCAIFGKPLTP